jgi:hypothetical protein
MVSQYVLAVPRIFQETARLVVPSTSLSFLSNTISHTIHNDEFSPTMKGDALDQNILEYLKLWTNIHQEPLLPVLVG